MAESDIRKLMCEITNCPEVMKSWRGESDICSKLVNAQPKNDFRVPEPWTGPLLYADILYVAINPSVRIGESQVPKWGVNPSDVYNFFSNGLTMREGKWWTKLKKYTHELGNYNYVVTNVAHCKSPKVKFVTKKIRNYCCDKYLNRIIKSSNAKLIVSIGKGRRGVERLYDIKPKENRLIYKKIGDKKRLFAYLHRQIDPTSFAFNYTPEETEEIRRWLYKSECPEE